MATEASLDMVQEFYIGYYGRPADPAGLEFWAEKFDESNNLDDVLAQFGTSDEFTANFGSLTNEELVNNLYQQMFGRVAEAEGLTFYTGLLESGEATLASIAKQIVDGASGDDVTVLANKVTVAQTYTDAVTSMSSTYESDDIADAQAILADVDVTDASVTDGNTAAEAEVASNLAPGETFTLTNDTDIATANIFDAPMVYVPDGSDRILSLQDEDVLTGTDGRIDNTLNVVMGNRNTDEGTTAIVTPNLVNIQNVNIDWTGNTDILDVRYADAVENININKITSDAGIVTVQNITTAAAELRVSHAADAASDATFSYQRGVLSGEDDIASLELDNVLANTVTQNSMVGIEGFETVNLNAINGVDINGLSVNQMENLNITGDSFLDIVALTPTTPLGTTAPEYDQLGALGAAGIANPGGVGIRTIDASEFTGDLTIDVSAALGGFIDPDNSGSSVYTVITGSAGNDTFWSSAAVAISDTIDGGAGTNKLVTTNGVAGTAEITNIQALELRQQAAGAQTVDFDAFDENMTSVLMRDEVQDGVAATFNLNNLGVTLAENGDIVLRHSITDPLVAGTDAIVNANLNDATGADDTFVITVENDLNTLTQFDYTINTDMATPAGKADGDQGVENVTINDNDTESNIVVLTEADEHTGTVNLAGGVAGQTYTVNGTLIAGTVEASAQLSDLTLTVGIADQKINLGAGDDTLTFDGLNTFNGKDSLSDVGGDDTVRAAFSKDVAGTPELGSIEALHIVANANTAIDLAKADSLTELALMSDAAVNLPGEIFTAPVAGININDEITLNNTTLDTINFFGDADGNAGITTATIQNFNALKLNNNTGDAIVVNISAPLQNGADSVTAGNGITTYNLGQLTTHGVKDLSVVVEDEIAGGGTTNINNIWDRDLISLTLAALGSVDVGTVTGNTTNNNITTFDALNVGGNTTAVVKALGNNALVALASGDDNFNALGSNGTNVIINAGEGNNTITGTSQADFITSGAGNDIIAADRGNNTVTSGAGNDTVTAVNGSNTVDIGAGFADSVTFTYDSAIMLNAETNVIAGAGTIATVNFNDLGTPVLTTYGFAVGDGAEMSLKFTGTTFDTIASTLNGRSAIVGATGVGTEIDTMGKIALLTGYDVNQSNLVVFTTNPATAETFVGGSAADAFIDLSAGTGNAYDVTAGDGNDAVVIAQTNTAAHIITGGTGADRIVLSTAAATDSVVVAEGDSTTSAWDIVANFQTGADSINLSSFTTGSAANLTNTATTTDFNGDGTADAVTVAVTGEVTVADGVTGNAVIGVDFTVDSVISYLAANSTIVNDAFFFDYDSNDNGGIDAADNVMVFQNLGTDMLIELVGSATNSVSGFSVAVDLV